MKGSNLSSIILTIFSGFIFTLLIIFAFLLLLVGSFEIFPRELPNVPLGQSLFQAISLMIIGVLVLPMGYFNIRRLLGRLDDQAKLRNLSGWSICLLTITWFLIIFFDERITAPVGEWTWFVELPLYLLSIGLPFIIIIWISLRGIPLGSKLRSWTILGLGLVLGPILILISEITLLLFSILVGSVYLAKNPVLNHELIAFLRQLLNNNSFEGVQEFVIPHLLNPWILAIILTFVSVIVPLVEEFIKPAGIWLIVKKNMKPVEGFVMGVLSGAGYALFETLAASGNMGTGQSGFLLGRAGTDLLHIFNTGIVGWAMISDWKLKGWFKLATVFILSVIIHGLWNGFALTVGISSFIKEFSEDYNWAHSSGIGGAFGLVILSLLLLSSLWMINLKFQNSGMEKEKIIDV